MKFKNPELSLVVYDFDLSTREEEVGRSICEFKVKLVYIVRIRTTRATY